MAIERLIERAILMTSPCWFNVKAEHKPEEYVYAIQATLRNGTQMHINFDDSMSPDDIARRCKEGLDYEMATDHLYDERLMEGLPREYDA